MRWLILSGAFVVGWFAVDVFEALNVVNHFANPPASNADAIELAGCQSNRRKAVENVAAVEAENAALRLQLATLHGIMTACNRVEMATIEACRETYPKQCR